MDHTEQSNEETMIGTETNLATETTKEESSSMANEMEEASSPQKKRTAPEHWIDESARSNHRDDTEQLIQMKADDVEKENVGDAEEESPDKQDEHEQATSHEKLSVDTSSSVVPERPIKKARTAYFIFAEEKRPELQKQNTGVGVTGMAKLIGQLWSSLSAEDKKIYQDKANIERERVAQDLQAWKAAGGVVPEPTTGTSSDPNALVFPAARIRKICKLDPDVKNLSKEALLLVCKAAELALSQLGRESVKVAQIQNRRKLIPEDVATVCHTREQFLFLREDIQDLARAAAASAQQQQQSGNKGKSAKADGKPQGRPITDFFAPKSVQ